MHASDDEEDSCKHDYASNPIYSSNISTNAKLVGYILNSVIDT